MKCVLISSSFIGLLLAGCAAPQSVEKKTSDRIIFSPQFLEDRVWDFRALVESENNIGDLEKKHMCLIKFGRLKSPVREILIGDSRKLKDVIQLCLAKPYDGQVKVVSRNAIVQTTIQTYDPEEQEDIIVLPGDIVFIDARF